uniref:Uncharacterized protein n=1 Tax=Arundo donax TaxID=35708 RepID=A0A0A9G4T7_ARUDO
MLKLRRKFMNNSNSDPVTSSTLFFIKSVIYLSISA